MCIRDRSKSLCQVSETNCVSFSFLFFFWYSNQVMVIVHDRFHISEPETPAICSATLFLCHFFLPPTTGVRGIIGSAYWSLCHIVPKAPVSAPYAASCASYFFSDFFLSHVINSSFHCRRDPDNASLFIFGKERHCLLYTSPSPRDLSTSRMPSSA